MKKIFLFIPLFSLIFCFSCASPTLQTQNSTVTVEEIPSLENTTTKPTIQSNVAEPITKAAIDAIPVANDEMSKEELRKLCVDMMYLQLTFPWQLPHSLSYMGRVGDQVHLSAGVVYGGNPYVTSNQSNVYRILYYYDEETGILDLDKIGPNFASIMGNQCSSNAFWAWSRVINSIDWGGTSNMTRVHGCIPLGSYQYDPEMDNFTQHSTSMICSDNGKEVMLEAFASVKMADGIVTCATSGTGHVQMATRDAVVVRNEDGTINARESYLYLQDQQTARSTLYQSNGKAMQIQAGIEHKTSFSSLYAQGYLPFTFAEFIGEDPIEKGEVRYSLEKEAATPAELVTATITANYAISDVEILIRNEEGEIVHHAFGFEKKAGKLCIKETTPKALNLISAGFRKYASDGKHQATVNVRLGNGEIHTLYQGALIAES